MSVKALNENGKWIDKSDNYLVYWELEESSKEKEGNATKNNEISKQGTTIINNDFPIKEEK
jgi:hypothetical protein